MFKLALIAVVLVAATAGKLHRSHGSAYHSHDYAMKNPVAYKWQKVNKCCIDACGGNKDCKVGCKTWLQKSSLNSDSKKAKGVYTNHKLLLGKCKSDCLQGKLWATTDKFIKTRTTPADDQTPSNVASFNNNRKSYWADHVGHEEKTCQNGCQKYFQCMPQSRGIKYTQKRYTVTVTIPGHATCHHNNAHDRIEYIEPTGKTSTTLSVKVGFIPQHSGAYTWMWGWELNCWQFTKGYVGKVFDHKGPPTRGSPFLTKAFTFTPKKPENKNHWLRCGLIDLWYKRQGFKDGKFCAARDAGSSMWKDHHYDNADMPFTIA